MSARSEACQYGDEVGIVKISNKQSFRSSSPGNVSQSSQQCRCMKQTLLPFRCFHMHIVRCVYVQKPKAPPRLTGLLMLRVRQCVMAIGLSFLEFFPTKESPDQSLQTDRLDDVVIFKNAS